MRVVFGFVVLWFLCLVVLPAVAQGVELPDTRAEQFRRVKISYDLGLYDEALLILDKIPNSTENTLEDWEKVRWLAKIYDKLKFYPLAYYLSGWLFLANDEPHTVWNARGYLFSIDPDRTAAYFQDPQKIKDDLADITLLAGEPVVISQIAKAVNLLAVCVTCQRKLEEAKLTRYFGHARGFEVLDMKVNGIFVIEEVGEPVGMQAAAWYNEMRIEADRSYLQEAKVDSTGIAPLEQSVRSLETSVVKVNQARYELIHLLCQVIGRKYTKSPDIYKRAGRAQLEIGAYKNDKNKIRDALASLERANELKPNVETEGLIVRAKQLLK